MLCIFLDAEHYIRDMNCLPVIQKLLESGGVPPVTCLFVSHVNGEARHRDYTCNNRYCRFIAEDVVTWARRRNEHINVGENLICGVSLSALAGAYAVFQFPSVFSFSLCQTGSFWWLADRDVVLPATKAKFWLSVGSKETATGLSHPPTGLFQRLSQIEGVENAAKRFELLGATVKYNLYSGGHAFAPLREELEPALKWLIG
jgi:enterochelin esterase family protein